MSHFSVLVAANYEYDLDAKLLPYHEYECTGITEYLEWVPEDMKYLENKRREYAPDKSLDEFVPEWCGAEKNEKGEWGRMTNPNAKWDWWTIGGRWTGLLQLKPEAIGKGHTGQPNSDPLCADSALVCEIDWKETGKGKCPTFAFVDTEGKWHQEAEMGWWGSTSDPNDSINQEWREFLANLAPTQRVFVVDCHI